MNDCKGIVETIFEDLQKVEDWQDWLDDSALEILRIVDSNGTLRGVIVVLASGGLQVEINTRDKTLGCWWGNSEKIMWLPSEICNNIEEAVEVMI